MDRTATSGCVTFAFQDLTGERYDIGRTPVRTIGPPLLARIGVRFHLGAR